MIGAQYLLTALAREPVDDVRRKARRQAGISLAIGLVGAAATLWLLVVVWALAGSRRAAPPLERAARAAEPPALGGTDTRARITARCRARRAILEPGPRGGRPQPAESHTIVRN